MSDEAKMLAEMRTLWRRDQKLFEKIIEDYDDKGGDIFPPDKRKRVYRQQVVMNWVWAWVEFLKWRDKVSAKKACQHIATHMPVFNLYDSPDGQWHRVKDGKPTESEPPPVFTYPVDGKGESPAHGETVRQTYNQAKNMEDQGIAELLLNQMKAAHEGRQSVLGDKHLPPLITQAIPKKL